MFAAWKSVIVFTIGFTKFAKDFNCEDQISKVNNKNQGFCHYCIGIHQLTYEKIDNSFLNLCLENE